MQNHLLQILTIVAMARPATLSAEDIRDEKVKVLRCIQALTLDNVILGQYTRSADGSVPGEKPKKKTTKNEMGQEEVCFLILSLPIF